METMKNYRLMLDLLRMHPDDELTLILQANIKLIEEDIGIQRGNN